MVLSAEAQISFDPHQLQLTFKTAMPLPRVAGPLAALTPKTAMRVDPRVLS